MSTAELKISLINNITNINDESVLMDIYRLLKLGAESTVISFSDVEKSIIMESLAQYKSGKFLSDEEADSFSRN